MIIPVKPVVTMIQTNKTLSTEMSSERFVDTMDRTLTSQDTHQDEPQPAADNAPHHDAADKDKSEATDPELIGLSPLPVESGSIILQGAGARPQIQQLLAQVSGQQAPDILSAVLTEDKVQMRLQAGRQIATGLADVEQQSLPEAENADDLMPSGTAEPGKGNLREPLWNLVGKSSIRDVAQQLNRDTPESAVTAPKLAGEPDKDLRSGLPQEAVIIKADFNATPLVFNAQPTSVIAEMTEDNVSQPITAHQAVAPGNALPLSAGVLNQPVNTPAWQQEMSQQLAIFYRHGVQNAELRLHPEELGALQISMRVVNNQAQMQFVTENHQVRAALEAAMPHLRTSLAESGINLGQSSVGGEGASAWQSSRQSGQGGLRSPRDSEGEDMSVVIGEPEMTPASQTRRSNGINTFV